jgi:predicted ATP-grasp superfamily ATP-dependent carboligase
VCAQLNSRGQFYGLDSIETSETINNKQKFREFSNKIGLPVPQIISKENIDEEWPVIVKPVDAFSGRGVTVIHKAKSNLLKVAINCAKEFSQLNSYIVEEYVEGQLFSHTAFIAGQLIVADFVVEEHGTANPFVVDTSRVDYEFPEEMLARIRAGIEMMAQSLSLVDGLIHTQFIKNGDDYWLIEITRRCPGDLYSQLIELSTSYSYVENYVRPFLNQKILVDNYTKKKSWIMRHTISQSTEGFFGSVQFNMSLLVEKMVPLCVAGDYLKASPFGRVGILFAKVDAKDKLDELFNITLGRNLYVINHQKDSQVSL